MKYRYIPVKSFLRYISISIIAVLTLFISYSGESYAAIITSSSSTVLTANLSSVLYLSNSANLTINAIPNSAGVQCFTYDNLSFYANASGGYTLFISDNSSTTSSLVSGSNTIPTLSSTTTAAAQTSGTINTWGYSVNPNPTSVGKALGVNFGSTFPISNTYPQTGTYGTNGCAALSSSYNLVGLPTYTNPQVISSSNGPVNTTYTTVYYGLYVNAAQAAGTYQTTIVYTLASNN